MLRANTAVQTMARRWWMMTLVVAAGALIAVACGGGGGGGGASFDDPRLAEFDDGLTTPGQGHLNAGVPFNYPTIPAHGGPHAGNLLPCSVYPDEQSQERILHSMEHGAVVIFFQPDVASGDDITQIRQLGTELLREGNRIVVAPNRQLTNPIVIASWARLLPLQTFEDATIRGFVDAFENDGPENIPRGNAC